MNWSRSRTLLIHNWRLLIADPAPIVLQTLMPIAMMAFLQGTGRAVLRQGGFTDANGAELVVPGMAVMFAFFGVAFIGTAFFTEHEWGTWERLRASQAGSLEIIMAKILPPVSQDRADAAWLQATRTRHVATAAAFGLLAVADSHDNGLRIRGGRMWQRMHLWATTQGLAMQPLNQMVERADRERQLALEPKFGTALAQLVGSPGLQALMPFRIGYPLAPGGLSPRRSVTSVLV